MGRVKLGTCRVCHYRIALKDGRIIPHAEPPLSTGAPPLPGHTAKVCKGSGREPE